MNRVGMYLRLSKKDDKSYLSNSIKSQKEVIISYIKENIEFEMIESYIDEGVSGTNLARPALLRLKEDILNGKINLLIIKDLSRLARNYLEVSEFFVNFIERYNVRFISLSEGVDSLVNPLYLQDILFSFKNILNDYYSLDISRKVKLIKREKMASGLFIGGYPPFGYKNVNNGLGVDEESSKTVRLIFDLYLKNNGYLRIAKYLNKLNIPSPSKYKAKYLKLDYHNPVTDNDNVNDKLWSVTSVKRILENEIYIGNYLLGKESKLLPKSDYRVKTSKDNYLLATLPPIITKETYLKAKKIKESKKVYDSNLKHENLFLGKLRCYKCKRMLIRKVIKLDKKISINYYCKTSLTKGSDFCLNFKLEHELLLKLVKRRLKRKLNEYLLVINKLDIYLKQNNLTKLKAKMNKESLYINYYLDLKFREYDNYLNEITSKDYLNKELEKLNNLINYHNLRLAIYQEKIEKVKELIKVRKKLEEVEVLKVSQDRNLIETMIDSIEVKSSYEIKIKYNYSQDIELGLSLTNDD